MNYDGAANDVWMDANEVIYAAGNELSHWFR